MIDLKYFSVFTGAGGFEQGMPNIPLYTLREIIQQGSYMSRPINPLFADAEGKFDYNVYKTWYNNKNPEKNKQYQDTYARTHRQERRDKERVWRQKIKIEVLGFYSDGIPECNSCGITDLRVLSIDHLENNGGKHRKEVMSANKGGSRFYAWLKKNNYPKSYQVLCMNCQFIKRS